MSKITKTKNNLSIKNEPTGYVYFILSPDRKRLKIGYAKNVQNRMKAYETHNPYKVNLIGYIPGSLQTEKELHEKFKHLKAHLEWFTYSAELKYYVNQLIKKHGKQRTGFVSKLISILYIN